MYGFQLNKNYTSNTTTDQIQSPVLVDELKTWLRLDSDDENDKLEMILKSATAQAIAYMQREILPRSFKLKLDRFPEQSNNLTGLNQIGVLKNWIDIPSKNLLSVESFTINGDAFNDYTLDLEGARINSDSFVYSENYVIDYTAGYTDIDAVPDAIKMGIILLSACIYEQTGECDASSILNKSGAKMLFNQFRTFSGGF